MRGADVHMRHVRLFWSVTILVPMLIAMLITMMLIVLDAKNVDEEHYNDDDVIEQ